MRGYTIQNSIDLLEKKGGGGGTSGTASDISYDNTISGLTADNVQEAIDELKSDIPTSLGASAITYDNTSSGLTADDVQEAIDELKSDIPTSLGASAITYTNSSSGLTADDVQEAIDEIVTKYPTSEAVIGKTSGGELLYGRYITGLNVALTSAWATIPDLVISDSKDLYKAQCYTSYATQAIINTTLVNLDSTTHTIEVKSAIEVTLTALYIEYTKAPANNNTRKKK